MVTDLNFTVDSVGQIVGVRHHDGLLRAISLEGGFHLECPYGAELFAVMERLQVGAPYKDHGP